MEKTSKCTQFLESQALFPHLRVSFAVTKHFLGSCVLHVGEQGGQGLQRKTQGTGMKRPHSDGGSTRTPVSAESYPHCFRNVYFYLPSFGSAGSSLRRGLFAGCAERGCALVAELGLLTAVASPAAEQGLRGSRAWAPEYRLSSCSPRAQMPSACGIFLGQRSKPRLLHRQADSVPLSPQGSGTYSRLVNESGVDRSVVVNFSLVRPCPSCWCPCLSSQRSRACV